MILPNEQDITGRCFVFSWGSNGVGKNEFASQFICFQSYLYVKIHTLRTHINTKKWQWTTF